MGILGSSIPKHLWDEEILKLPHQLVEAHRNFLTERNWHEHYSPKSKGIVGGESSTEARDHVVNRFLNSAARMQYVTADPLDEQPDVRSMILEQLADGQIDIIDLAAGNGAGTLAIFSLITELRSSSLLPQLPLNAHIVGVDISADALTHYADLLNRIDPWLKQHGINTSLELNKCDLTISGEFHDVLEAFFEEAKTKNTKRFLCTISALSGAQKEGLEAMHNSLSEVAKWFGRKNRNSSILWVEPNVSKGWFETILESFQMTFHRISHLFLRKEQGFKIESSNPAKISLSNRKFKWLDPYLKTSTYGHVSVFTLRSKNVN